MQIFLNSTILSTISLISEIAEKLPGVGLGELRKTIYKMVGNELVTTGGRTYRRYDIKDGRKEKK